MQTDLSLNTGAQSESGLQEKNPKSFNGLMLPNKRIYHSTSGLHPSLSDIKSLNYSQGQLNNLLTS